MFQFIFIFPDWILMEQIIASSTPSVLGKTDFQNILLGVLSGGLRHKYNAFFRNMSTISYEIFPTHFGIYKSEKIQQVSGEIKP